MCSRPPSAFANPQIQRRSSSRQASFHSTRWLSFDQLLVSAEFLDGEWQIEESKVAVWGTDLLLGEKGTMLQKFDHLPLLGEVARCVRMQTDGGSSDG